MLTLFDDITRSHHHGDPESNAANLRVNKTVWQQRAYELCARGCGATADEAAAHYNVPHNTIAPRFSELKRDGRIAVAVQNGRPVKRPTRQGCMAKVYVAVVAAVEAA